MVTFDNLRVLHGRTAFGENLKGERHVQGAYVDWDEARSKIRVLKANKSNQKYLWLFIKPNIEHNFWS